MRFTTKVLPSRSGNVGVLLLNNPKALHALSIDMIHCFQDVLKQWYQDDSMAAVLVKASAEAKVLSFCAGGDVKQVYLSGMKSTDDKGNSLINGQGISGVDTAEFFRQEYYVNHMLATAPKPQVSLWDGIVMGGGVGISIHGQYRVATENTTFAMPETAIGLFPDVGSMYWMPRMLPMSVARYLALTGSRLKAPDLVATGLATHYIPSNKLIDFEEALVKASQRQQSSESPSNIVAPVLLSFHEPPSGDPCMNREAIDHAFGIGVTTIEGVFAALGSMDNDFGSSTLAKLHRMSPTSLKLTFEGLTRGAACKSISDDLALEYRMSQACMRPGSDFYEGIRAMLVDKDHNPKWSPNSLDKVGDLSSFFSSLSEEWTMPPDLIFKQRNTSML